MTNSYYRTFLCIALLSLSQKTFAQGNDCGSATALPVNTTCITQGFNNNENDLGPEFVASCATGGTSYEDVWYTLTGTGNPMTVTISGTILSATTSPQANGCFGTASDDVWYFIHSNYY